MKFKRAGIVRPLALLYLFCGISRTKAAGHRYKAGDPVDLWVNKVGPYANPQEAYDYYTLPYCKPLNSHREFNELKSYTLGEILGGHTLRSSGHNVHFPPHSEDTDEECTTSPLTADEAKAFSRAAQEQWFYQMYLDDLPVWGMVGEVLPEWDSLEAQQQYESKIRHGESDYDALQDAIQGRHRIEGATLFPFVYTERVLTIAYNHDRIVQVDLVSDPVSLKKVKVGDQLTFKLSIKWEKTADKFHSRFERYLDHEFFKHQIHWFSIFNSFMMVIFLSSLVSLIMLRSLKRDYARYAHHTSQINVEDGEGGNDKDGKPSIDSGATFSEESGWKQVHGDVFRAPPFLPLFSALLGVGWQIVTLITCVLIFAVAGPLHGDVYEERGELLHAFLIAYFLSSIVAGYSSGSCFKRYFSTSPASANKTNTSLASGSQAWQGVLLLTIVIPPIIVTSIVSILNVISIYYGTISTITFLVILKLFLLWIFISVPLTVIGTLLGRHQFVSKDKVSDAFPCRVNSIPRPIPDDVSWYGRPIYLIPVAGLLPFGSIFIELYYVLTSLWNYKYYHVYGFLLAMYFILATVVSLTSIISIYFCLNAENYRWQWTSFFAGASTSLYVFLYGVFYFFFKTSMHGLLQTAFYFGYTFLLSISLGVLCGTFGHNASSKFVKTIFRNVKVD